jgi:hypothetical protein
LLPGFGLLARRRCHPDRPALDRDQLTGKESPRRTEEWPTQGIGPDPPAAFPSPILLTEKNCRRQRHVPQAGERPPEQQVGREVDGEWQADFL